MLRAVDYIRCKVCNKQVDVYFAHGAIQVYACIYCYKSVGRLGKVWNKLMIKIRGHM
jgi:hypothetical protein